MIIKDGAILSGLNIIMRPVLKAADKIWKAHGQELVVTSGLDGTHSAGSYHYYGRALDFRTRYFSSAEKKKATSELQTVLGVTYDVILEADHIHVEPKQ